MTAGLEWRNIGMNKATLADALEMSIRRVYACQAIDSAPTYNMTPTESSGTHDMYDTAVSMLPKCGHFRRLNLGARPRSRIT